MTSLVPTIHADLPPAQRRAFGAWVRAVYGLVAHLDGCCFGCTAEQTRCSEGDAVVDAEQQQWQSWRTANVVPSADGAMSWRAAREGEPC